MAITVEQIPSTLATIENMARTLNDLRMLIGQAKELSDKGWVIDIGSRFSIPLTVSVQQRQGMIAQYDTLKAQLVSTFQTLP